MTAISSPMLLPNCLPREARRGRLVLSFLLIAYAVLGIRFWQLQITEHERLRSASARQTEARWRWNECRGPIVDAQGQLLAVSVPTWSCALDPLLLRQSGAKEEEVLEALARALRLTPAEVARIAEGLHKPGNRFIWVRRLLSEKEMAALREARVSQEMLACAFAPQRAQAAGISLDQTIAALEKILRLSAAEKRRLKEAASSGERVWIRRRLSVKEREALHAAKIAGVYIPRQSGPLPGLFFQPTYRRYYPAGALAAHVLGFCDIDGRGREGIEATWHAFLAALPAEQVAMRDACRRPLLDSSRGADDKRQGYTVELTIISAMQRIAEEELAKE
ncbi:MAG: hypothetical protein N3A66_10665, partial [Planctomycetota bacterium]|nr:hypothetical protein [Planctomycetota bacterium]